MARVDRACSEPSDDSLGGFDSDGLIDKLASAATPVARFAALTAGLATIGLDTVNYGFFDARTAEMAFSDIQFLTTMSDDWMRHYYDRSLADSDAHVVRVKAQKITPYIWGEREMLGLERKDQQVTAITAAEAGLQSALCVPMTNPLDPFSPIAGMTLGSSLGEVEFGKILAEHGATLLSIAYLFHNASIRQLWREREGGRSLSPRERDCLRYLADGKRQDAIAHAMGLSRVTVEMHLRAARQKLGARTLNEAIAKALVLGEISRE